MSSHNPHSESPFNALPPVVVFLALAIAGVEIGLQLGQRGLLGGPEAVGWRLGLIQRFSVVPDLFRAMWAQGIWPPEHLLRLVAYPFVHASFGHAIFVVVFILALGKMVAEVFAAWAVLVVYFGASAVAGLVYSFVVPSEMPLFGGYPGAYGLIGAFTFLLWTRLAASGGPQGRAFSLIGFLMGIQLLFGLLFGGGLDWVADLAGFATGFLLSFVVSPGGWARVSERLRRR
ncbi:rhomboid family intramembrane serine protease [Psychromarinibacter halotolerans]|uniref:Rhomboid family intramembrane serine protease n=1 Tax=Psychromarinibacter halotolerans TaxID=1775175 RepID=A0ABV7GMY0_9RHOB|nr:rhomboid family intramembrane serine protease [Psychromarinibacter halotolerans]MDF0595509.1 rhomboid family intramembrane serine protease [Psychromarinibacter halotolerans]